MLPVALVDDKRSMGDAARCSQNQKRDFQQQQQINYKVIEPLGHQAALGKSNFDTSLDENSQKWFDQINQYYKQYKKSSMLSKIVQSFYESVSNPFIYALKFFANTNDHANPKSNTLAFVLLEELQIYRKRFRNSDAIILQQMLDDNTKFVAFNFLKKCGQITAFRLVVDVFELISSKHLFVDALRELITAKHFKEAGQIACDLQLYNEFELEDFLIPLLLQDKLGIFEDYLDKAVELRAPTLELLDSFLQRESSVRSICDYYIAKYNLQDVKYEKLHKKPVAKLLNRLLRKYQMSDNIAPNMKKQKEFGSLFFILRKNYVEKSLNQASFDEMVKDTIGRENKELQAELVHSCWNYGSLEDAVKWAIYYEVPHEDMPSQVSEAICSGNIIDSNHSLESFRCDEEVHTLSLDNNCVLLISDVHSYHAMINDLKNAKIISFDSEWKPNILSCTDVSLIQLATRDRVYLLDVITLMQRPEMSEKEWNLLGNCIFNNEEILKLGFAHSTDISMLVKFQAFNIQHNHSSSHSYLDLQGLWQKVVNFPDFRFPFHDEQTSQSLSNLVKLCLGKKLDKSNQFSNWQQRPLRAEQITYASLDAYCLFEIYDVIGDVISKMGINYDELINNILMENKKDIASLTKVKDANKQKSHSKNPSHVSEAIYRPPINVNGVKFVTDYMIGSVGRKLREIGVDTFIMKGEFVDHDQCIRISQNDDRVVLTASKPLFIRYQKYTKLGYAYLVENSHNEHEALKEIVHHFKINIKRQDMFSRCIVCNCDEFVLATKIDMIRMKYINLHIPNEMRKFLSEPGVCSKVENFECRNFRSFRRFSGQNVTKFGTPIDFSSINDHSLSVFQTFFICEYCAKIYWEGSHYKNTEGRFKNLFNLYSAADSN